MLQRVLAAVAMVSSQYVDDTERLTGEIHLIVLLCVVETYRGLAETYTNSKMYSGLEYKLQKVI